MQEVRAFVDGVQAVIKSEREATTETRKAEQLAQAREESIARALRGFANKPLDDWEIRYAGLQRWVEREQTLPQFGGTLPAEEKFAM